MQRCNICETTGAPAEEAHVRSNVRKFRDEQFRIWRCAACASVHATDEVDLAHYYRSYPFHNLGEERSADGMLRAMYRKQLRRLRAAGLKREDAVLDYGCGGGAFVRFLRAQGHTNVQGFDEYSDGFNDRRVLDARYDFILSQDVLEHVAEPWDLLGTLSRLLAPLGAIAIGTPNASALDLRNPESSVHTMHQPYHRHIFSQAALLGIGAKLRWELLRYYPTMYANTLLPFVNQRFVLRYYRICDDVMDLATEPIHVRNPRLYSPVTLFWALFGGFFAPKTDVMVIYRKRS